MRSLILCILLAVGFLAGKRGVWKPETIRSLSRFVVNYALPGLVVMAMQKPFTPELRDQALRTLLFSSIYYTASIPLAYAITSLYRRADRAEKGVHQFSLCFANVAFMGFPVAEALLGPDSLFMVSIHNIPFQFLAFSLGVFMISGGTGAQPSERSKLKSVLSLFISPVVVASAGGFALFLLSIKVPEPFASAFTLLGSTTTPLAMVLIGGVLAGSKLGRILSNPRLWTTSAIRLVGLPILVFAAFKAIGFTGWDLEVPVLMAAMPVAANATILAGVYGGDLEVSSGIVSVTTAAALVTIPAIHALLLA